MRPTVITAGWTGSMVLAGCARRGVVALGCGTYGNVIRLLPPLVIEFGLLGEALDILAEALAEATA
jgi:4-aminobutyrate aminotransferase/(S)-3-amino-2-methylpropionate transaminase